MPLKTYHATFHVLDTWKYTRKKCVNKCYLIPKLRCFLKSLRKRNAILCAILDMKLFNTDIIDTVDIAEIVVLRALQALRPCDPQLVASYTHWVYTIRQIYGRTDRRGNSRSRMDIKSADWWNQTTMNVWKQLSGRLCLGYKWGLRAVSVPCKQVGSKSRLRVDTNRGRRISHRTSPIRTYSWDFPIPPINTGDTGVFGNEPSCIYYPITHPFRFNWCIQYTMPCESNG